MKLRLDINPIPAPRPRVTSKGWTYYPKRYREWREQAAELVPDALSTAKIFDPFTEALFLKAHFIVKRPKTTKLFYPLGDIDNYLKTLDCFNELLWIDDKQIVQLEASKSWAPLGELGHIDIEVEGLGKWR